MYSVLIADDEPKIRNGIKGFIDWTELGLNIAAEAEDGEIALQKAREVMPDILLLDICMPFLNGLELIEELKGFLKDSVIIIISGHDEFDYAQKALKLRVFDYLLKPIRKESLEAVLQKAVDHLNSLKNQKRYMEMAAKQLEQNMPFLKEKFFNQVIEERLTDVEILENARFFNIEIPERSMMILVRFPEDEIETGDPGEFSRELSSFMTQNISNEVIGTGSPLIFFRDRKENLIIVGNTNRYTEEELSQEIEKSVESILRKKIAVVSTGFENGILGLAGAYGVLLDKMQKKCGFSPMVAKIVEYIENHYADPGLSINDLTGRLFISAAYVTRLLKGATGYTFVDYLTHVRIEKALALLNNPNYKIVDIAQKVGYSSQHYFSTAFKKVLGVSPSQYKKGGEPF